MVARSSIARFGFRHTKAITFVVAVLAIMGVAAYRSMPASIFPNMSFARIDVVVDAGNLPPDQVRQQIALPLTRAFLGLPGATHVLATSAQGNSELLVDFSTDTDSRFDLQYVNQAIAQQRSTLPAVADPQTMIVTPTSEVVIAYAFRSRGVSQTVLREIVQQDLVPKFYGTPGLARIAIMGGPDREFHVQLDPSALAAHGLTASDVAAALSDANLVTALGVRQQYYQRNVITIESTLKNEDALRSVMLAGANHEVVSLGSIAAVSQGVAPASLQASYNAQHAVVMNFYSLPGADAVKMAGAIKTRMDRVLASRHDALTIDRAWDQSDLVLESQRNLRDAILMGAALAVLVILLFLRDWRVTLVSAVIIPLAMAITVFLMHLMGETLNLMSVGGLAVAVGLIIDDAIVVVENVARHLADRREGNVPDAVAAAMSELAAPMAASTLTIVVVFVPLLMLSGIAGFFFRSLAFTLGEALVVSLALSLFVAPVLARAFVRAPQNGEDRHARSGRRYAPLLLWALRHRNAVYGACVVVLIATFAIIARVPSDFLPQLDEGQLQIDYRMPVGTTLDASDRAATQIERVVLADPAVASVVRLTGADPNGFSPIQVREGKLRIRLKPRGVRAPYDVVSDRLRDAVSAAVPAADLEFAQLLEEVLGDLSGSVRPIMIEITGPDQARLVQYATALAAKLSRDKTLTDVFSGVEYDDPTQPVQPLSVRLASVGLTVNEFSQLYAAQTQGIVATNVAQGNLSIPVRVTVAGDGALVPTASGAMPFGDLAQAGRPSLTTDVTDDNGQRSVTVTAGTNADLSSAIAAVKRTLASTPVPPGYAASIGGAYRDQQRSFGEFARVIGIAVVLVFLVMLAAFRSFRVPLVILAAIPLALIGVALALLLTSTPLNVSSLMGLLLLVGIVVKNGILLVDVANKRRAQGADVETALLDAGRTRLRPIVMTTFAAIGGLLPLAFGGGAGAAMEKPLAIAVIGGLSTATAFTLIVIPVLYAGIAGRRQFTETV